MSYDILKNRTPTRATEPCTPIRYKYSLLLLFTYWLNTTCQLKTIKVRAIFTRKKSNHWANILFMNTYIKHGITVLFLFLLLISFTIRARAQATNGPSIGTTTASSTPPSTNMLVDSTGNTVVSGVARDLKRYRKIGNSWWFFPIHKAIENNLDEPWISLTAEKDRVWTGGSW